MLDANQLEALAAVLEHGSFGAAARSLNLTLAAVSLRIRSLETRLGQRLLVRGKTVRATPAGRVLQGHVKQLRLMEADLITDMQGGEVDARGRAENACREGSTGSSVRCRENSNALGFGSQRLREGAGGRGAIDTVRRWQRFWQCFAGQRVICIVGWCVGTA